MKKLLTFVLCALLFVVSCDSDDDRKEDSPESPAGIEGSWTLSEVQGAPASDAGIEGTMTVEDGKYTRTTTFSGSEAGVEEGEYELISDLKYTFRAEGGSETDYTLSSDGNKLSNTGDLFLGDHSYSRN